MFCKGTKHATDRVERSTEVLNIQRRGSNGPRRCYIFPGEGQMFHGGAKYSTERVKCSTEVLNVSRTM